MINFFYELNPLIQTLLASVLTLLATILGAFSIYIFKVQNKKVLQILLGISSGIMLGAAFFSLLLHSIDSCNELNFNPSIIIPVSIIGGCLFLIFGDKVTSKYTNSNSSFLLVISIILHNIPEGMTIGVAFGSVTDVNMIGAAISLTLGIAIQNIPESAAIALPLINKGVDKKKAFCLGILSGIVEPISAVIGYLLVSNITYLLPFMLAFAAGAMIFVVVKELIPESQESNSNLISLLTLIGFLFMMLLEI